MLVRCAMLLLSLSFITGVVSAAEKIDVSGDWNIHEEERSYIATLDRDGNGTYTWQNGRLTTSNLSDHRWQGTWQQPGNDREGGFEVTLAPDGTTAEGKWWYTRVGQQAIPPGEWGGNFTWKRVTPVPPSTP